MQDLPHDAKLYADSNRGVYIPQYFAESCTREYVTCVSQEDWKTLEAGPESEWYWESWDVVLDNAVLTDKQGKQWVLYQDGDLWVVPKDWQPTDEE